MKTIKKVANSKHHIYLYTCNCGSYAHQLAFSFWDDTVTDGEETECFLSFIIEPKGLWERIKVAFGVLFRKNDVYIEEIMLAEKDLRELKNGLNKALSLLPKRKHLPLLSKKFRKDVGKTLNSINLDKTIQINKDTK